MGWELEQRKAGLQRINFLLPQDVVCRGEGWFTGATLPLDRGFPCCFALGSGGRGFFNLRMEGRLPPSKKSRRSVSGSSRLSRADRWRIGTGAESRRIVVSTAEQVSQRFYSEQSTYLYQSAHQRGKLVFKMTAQRPLPASTRLRQMLAGPNIVVLPGVYDGISARVALKEGFKALYMTGVPPLNQMYCSNT